MQEKSDNLPTSSSSMMLCEDQLMIIDGNSALSGKGGAGSLNTSGSSTASGYKPLQCTWAEEVRRTKVLAGDDDSSLPPSCFNSSNDSLHDENKIKTENVANCSAISSEREIAVEFIDDANEVKFDRLIKEEKLKAPFKRRHSNTPSNGSRSNSPNSSNSEADAGSNSGKFFNNHKIEKRLRHNSYTSSSSSSSYTESDPAILSRRQKQIDYGKNTTAYARYLESVPKSKRNRDHPRTPNKQGKYSRRAFDGLIKIWRKQLHSYDPPSEPKSRLYRDNDSNSDSDSD